MAMPYRPSTLSFSDSRRQSPFRRQNSTSPATARTTTPTQSPTKVSSNLSPTKIGSLSPEKQSPFVRRPSQASQDFARPSSPFARPNSSLSIPVTPSRQGSTAIESEGGHGSATTPTLSRHGQPQTVTPGLDGEDDTILISPVTTRLLPSPSPSPFVDGPTPDLPASVVPSQASLRATAQRTDTSSTISPIRPPAFATSKASRAAPERLSNAVGGYSHVPQSLLRSMRESFEVLDSTNSGFISSASVASILEQMGLDSKPAGLKDFFPANGPTQLNLARYLDTLSGPLAELSHPDELTAAFEAFDVDDSGQIDIAELRHALLHTAPEPGEDTGRLGERELDSILGEFASRRAFGGKGLTVAKGKGEVFRYRDFMVSVSGGVDDGRMEAAPVA